MPLLITELMLGDVNTISIPTDAIFTVSLLMLFALLGYFFNRILSNNTNQFAQKIDDDSNLELVKEKLKDQLTLESTKLDQESLEKQSIRKFNPLLPSKVLGLGSLAVAAMGGASLLGLQHIQKTYEGVSTSRAIIQLDTQSTQSQLSMVKLKPLNKMQTEIKKISYINPYLSTIKSSTDKNVYKMKGQQIDNNLHKSKFLIEGSNHTVEEVKPISRNIAMND